MANFEELPQELYINILSHLSRNDLRTLRLVCWKAHDGATPALFADVHFSLTPESWQHLHALSKSDHLTKHVRTLYLSQKILPMFRDQQAWAKCIDIRPFLGQYWTARSRETGERIFPYPGGLNRTFMDAYDKLQKTPWDMDAVYAEYQQLLESQKAMIYDYEFRHVFESAVRNFAQLTALRTVPSHEWWYEGPVVHPDRTVTPYDRFLHWFKPKEKEIFKCNASVFYMKWRWGGEDVPVFRSSILQHQTIAAYTLLPIFAAQAQGRGFSRLQTLQLSLGLDALGRELSFLPPVSPDSDIRSTDSWLYARTTMHFLQIFRDTNIAHVVKLHLEIQYGCDSELRDNTCEGLYTMLGKASSLKELRMALYPPILDYTADLLKHVCDARIPKLRSLVLDHMSTTDKSLAIFVQNQSSTLTMLELGNIHLNDGSWINLLQAFPRMLGLHWFRARNLDIFHDDVHAHQYLSRYAEDAYNGLWDYVVRRGAWPGLEDDLLWVKRHPLDSFEGRHDIEYLGWE